MLFSSFEYVLFLGAVLLLYYHLEHRAQNLFLLAASLFFYSYWDYRFLSLILTTILINFYGARAIDGSSDQSWRKRYLWLGITVNLGILAYFKYFNFFVDNAARIVAWVGLEANLTTLQLVLPVGISFCAFQSISYLVDVYRKQIKPANDIPEFALFVAFFPKVVAGPIERAGSFLPQIQRRRNVTNDMFVSGCLLILVGLFRKVVIADPLAAEIAPCFASPATHSTPDLVKALYLFALQIYCDFAGYSDMARGSGRLFGIELTTNFNHPYFAPTITEFWRRWHISLSTWLRDYLFFPLCGKKNGRLRVCRNLIITMLLAGLWHGAAWSFVVWGGLHGVFLAANWLLVKKVRFLECQPLCSWQRLAGIIVTFHLVLLSLVFFRAAGIKAALVYLQEVVSLRGMSTGLGETFSLVLIPWILMLAVDIPQYLSQNHVRGLKWPVWARTAAVAAMLFLVLMGFGSRAPFIYFQF